VGGPSGAARKVHPPSDEDIKYVSDSVARGKQDSKVCKSLWTDAVEYNRIFLT